MEIKGKIKSFGTNVLGQWRNHGNHTAARNINTVYALYKLKQWPPGDFVSAFFVKRPTYKSGRTVDSIPMVLIGTSATAEQLKDWEADNKQHIFETIPIDEVPAWCQVDENDTESKGRVLPGTYAIKIDELVYEVETLKISFKDLAKKYNCTYTNVYAKYNRYKNRLAQGLVHTDNIRSLPMDIYTIHKQIVEENMSYQELAEEYKTSYQNVYNYYKRHKSKLIS